jgi:hypothetical protein
MASAKGNLKLKFSQKTNLYVARPWNRHADRMGVTSSISWLEALQI